MKSKCILFTRPLQMVWGAANPTSFWVH